MSHQQVHVALRSVIPADMSVGISGDHFAAQAVSAGCDGCYSVLGGVLPRVCQKIFAEAAAGDSGRAADLSDRLLPLWLLFRQHGSYRVVSALAEELGLVRHPNLPRPVLGLDESVRKALKDVIERLRAQNIPGLESEN